MINVCYDLQPSVSSVMDMHYVMHRDDSFNSIDDLENILTDDKNSEWADISYARYWHGYIVYLKPLLAFLSYEHIRLFINISLYVLLTLFEILCYKELGIKEALVFLASFLFVNFSDIHYSIQFANVFVPTLICLIMMLLMDKDKLDRRMGIIAFVLGSIIVFLDLLTTPVVSIGLVLILYSALCFKKKLKLKK